MEFYGVIPSEDAQRLSLSSDFLINLNNSIYNQLPSKLYEYISSGYPLINICKHKDCPSLKYTKKYGNSIDIFENDLLELSAEKIVKFVNSNMGKVVPYSEVRNAFNENTIEYATEFIEKLVQ